MNQEACATGWRTSRNGERTVTTDDDSALVSRFLKGDNSAFDALFSRHQDYVYHILYGIVGNAEEARDLTQDVFVQVYRSLPKFRQGSRFATWLYRIAVNRGVDSARSSKKWRFLPIFHEPGFTSTPADQDFEPEHEYERKLERETIQQALQLCSLSHRETLVLRYYQDLSLEEIAETLNCSLSAAKVRLHRARIAFKNHYVAKFGTEALCHKSPGREEDKIDVIKAKY